MYYKKIKCTVKLMGFFLLNFIVLWPEYKKVVLFQCKIIRNNFLSPQAAGASAKMKDFINTPAHCCTRASCVNQGGLQPGEHDSCIVCSSCQCSSPIY